MKDYDFLMEEKPRPLVKPKEEVWIYCERLAEKYKLDPLQVLKELVRIGAEAVDTEENGNGNGKVVSLLGDKRVKISNLPPSVS